MKSFSRIVLSLILILSFVALAFAGNTTLVVPSGINKVVVKNGTAYVPSSGKVTVPSLHVSDLLNAGFTFVPNSTVVSCGASNVCAATDTSTSAKVFYGAVNLVAGSPSAATVTGFSPAFASNSAFRCSISNMTTAGSNVVWSVASNSSITITGGAVNNTDTISYLCMGN